MIRAYEFSSAHEIQNLQEIRPLRGSLALTEGIDSGSVYRTYWIASYAAGLLLASNANQLCGCVDSSDLRLPVLPLQIR
jgi:hypothetical protein